MNTSAPTSDGAADRTGGMLDAYPMFPTVDIATSVGFYERDLGFTVVFQHGDEYARVQRDSVIIDLWLCRDPAMKGNEPGCRLMVESIDPLYEEFRATIPNVGADSPRPTVTTPETRPWGLREFAVLDPDNNVLHIGERA